MNAIFRFPLSDFTNPIHFFTTSVLLLISIIGKSHADINEQERIKRVAHQELERGLKAFKSKKLRKGITHYEKAYRLAPDHQTLFTIANAYDRLPKSCEKSLQSWERLMMRCHDCNLKEKIQTGYQQAQGRCNIKLKVTTPQPDAHVIINNESYGETPLSVLLPAKAYLITVKQPNGLSYHGKITLEERSQTKRLTFYETATQLSLTPPKALEDKEIFIANTEARSPSSRKEQYIKPKKTSSSKQRRSTKKRLSSKKRRRLKKRSSKKHVSTPLVVSQKKEASIKPEEHKMSLKSGSNSKVVVNASLQCMFKSDDSTYLPYPDCDGASLKEGDRFRVILSSPQKSFIYLFLTNDHGDRVMLFPDVGVNNQLKANVEYVIPGEDWYELDENGGVKENIRLIASRNRIIPLEEARGLELNVKTMEILNKMSFRGVRKTRKPAKMSVRLQYLDTVINSTGNEDSASISFKIDHKH
jgi:hypothetical protein